MTLLGSTSLTEPKVRLTAHTSTRALERDGIDTTRVLSDSQELCRKERQRTERWLEQRHNAMVAALLGRLF